jgi:hypothetical protein
MRRFSIGGTTKFTKDAKVDPRRSILVLTFASFAVPLPPRPESPAGARGGSHDQWDQRPACIEPFTRRAAS